MIIVPIQAFTDNYIWLVVNEEQHTAISVDPGDSGPVLHYLNDNQLTLEAIVLTHHHFDHVGGVEGLLTTWPNTPVYAPDDSRIPAVTHPLREGDRLCFSNMTLQVLSTTGHTSTHISLYDEAQNLLFCGDTLFSAGCGRVFDGTLDALHGSLARLKALPDATQVYCAHEYTQQNLRFAASVEPQNEEITRYLEELDQHAGRCTLPSTMAKEKKINPFLRTQEPAVLAYVRSRGLASQESLLVFQQLREDKNNFKT
ncbi:hydroxyacylglutathione hydrolase [Legionella taurinensis]|uniref:Hydroxyacylglutathione hydrolase n=1 Tax=Legionella taurinensis TaxID=70611 RepID=A0A3A5L6L0_9GAMM|nr:hydroxyacylglutathione hydrolase [Legionella taurinensis]RJT46265.1 hydroxyacylglutathione hydrolase [Legionella taurinensis]RJT67018.1 hydroxyacylglutathione hydrolase [Legionella taurinensis]STY26503.1 hydroxyacylglutathione hydrolase [Legionella taurinensis]